MTPRITCGGAVHLLWRTKSGLYQARCGAIRTRWRLVPHQVTCGKCRRYE